MIQVPREQGLYSKSARNHCVFVCLSLGISYGGIHGLLWGSYLMVVVGMFTWLTLGYWPVMDFSVSEMDFPSYKMSEI